MHGTGLDLTCSLTTSSPIIDVNPSLGSSMHVDVSAEYMYTLCFHHKTQGGQNCKEQQHMMNQEEDMHCIYDGWKGKLQVI